MVLNPEERAKLEEAVTPLIKFMAENYHPHTQLIVTCGRAELVEGVAAFVNDSFVD